MSKSLKLQLLVFCLLSAGLVQAQIQPPADRISVPFSDPTRPGFIEASLINGAITVEGYDGKEVIIEAKNRAMEIDDEDRDIPKGMKQLNVTSTGLEVEEQNNEMSIGVESSFRTVDLNLKAPVRTSLQVSTINSGDIYVNNIQGEVEISNVNGEIKALNISGTLIANTTNGDVKVTFNKITPDKPMSFASLNGDVDVTFPADLKANVKLKSEHGEVYSDYDVQLEARTNVTKNDDRSKGGKYHLKMESFMYGKINGGGPEYYFSTFNGRIYIRKGK